MNLEEIVNEIEATKKQGYGEYITINGIKIHYLVRGSGTPVLLLHGFGEFLETWAFNIPPLSRDYRVYAIDLPGHGRSDKPDTAYTLDFSTEYAAAIVKAFGIRNAILMGHSLGGTIGLNVALNFPGVVSKLVLVDSAGLSSRMPLAYRLSSRPVLGRILMSLTMRPALRRGLERLFYNPRLISHEMIDIALANSHRPGARKVLLNILRNNVSFRGLRSEVVMNGKLPQVKVPTLFVHGAQDTIFPLQYVREAFGLVPGARVKIFDQCGHCPHIERAVEFNETVREFLESS